MNKDEYTETEPKMRPDFQPSLSRGSIETAGQRIGWAVHQKLMRMSSATAFEADTTVTMMK